ncbi:MAG: DNA primase [Proteobacteria bacterium]|nr:DNA primase [Pseudomonadota bacterium]
MLLSRLDKVRRCGRGWIARCPAHEDSSASLSVAEGSDGRALVRDFGGCELHAIVRALGIEIADLFPERIRDTSPEGRAAMREAHRQSGWAAALNVLAREASIVAIAGRTIAQGQALNADDAARLQVALERIESAREVLA